MASSFLFTDSRGGVAPIRCFHYSGSSANPIGATFGSQFTDSQFKARLRHGAKFFQGELYAVDHNGVHKKDDPTTNDIADTWTIDVAFTTPEVIDPRSSGLHVVYLDGVPNLIAVKGYAATDTSWGWVKFDGTTWTEDSGAYVLSTAGDLDSVLAVIVYRDVIHMIGVNGTNVNAITFDPGSNTFAAVANPFTTLTNMEMCVYNDRLLCVYLPASRIVRLCEYSGGEWVDLPGSAGHTAAPAASGYVEGAFALFTDGTDLYAMVPSTDDGWRCLKWGSALGTPTNISATVLPTTLLSSGDSGSYSGSIEHARFTACYDQETDPAVADIWLFQSRQDINDRPLSTTLLELWKWNGPSTLITSSGTGGDVFHSIPSGAQYGGEHQWVAGKLDIWVSGRVLSASTGGKQRIKFRCSGAAGVANKTVRFKFNDQNEPTLATATLTGMGVISGSPAGSPSLGTNTITGVDADPTVEYYADWDVVTDSFAGGDRAQLKPVIA